MSLWGVWGVSRVDFNRFIIMIDRFYCCLIVLMVFFCDFSFFYKSCKGLGKGSNC